MTVSTLRPDGTTATSDSPSLTGGATAHAVLSDDSDASYATFDNISDGYTLSFGDFTLPAGAVIKSVQVRARSHLVSGSGSSASLQAQVNGLPGGVLNSGLVPNTWTTPTTYAVTPVNNTAGMSEAQMDALTVLVGHASGSGDLRLMELYVDVTYVPQPTVTVDTVTDPTTTTNRPTFTCTPTLNSDGGAQTAIQWRLFTDAQYLAGGFDPATSTATAESGVLSGSSTSWQPDVTLADDTYRVYVRVAQTVNGVTLWSAYAFDEFTLTVALPGTPGFTATADSANGRIALAITNVAGAASTDGFELERSLDGGTTFEPVRTVDGDGALETPFVVASTSFSDTVDGTSHAVSYPSPPDGVLENDLLIAVAGMDGTPTFTWPAGWTEIKDEAGNGSAVRAGVAWKRAAGGETGTFTVTTSASEGGGIICHCIRNAHTSTAPEVSTGVSSAAANANPDSLNPSGWDIEPTLWIAAMVLDGNVAVTAAPSGYFNLLNARWANASGAGVATAERLSMAASEDPGAFTHTLEDSRAFTIGVRPRNANLTVYDYEAPNGTAVQYRARAVHDYSGGSAAGAWATDTETWTSSDWWLKHPNRPVLNRVVKVRSFKTKGREHRVGTFQALGATSVVTVADTRGPLTGATTFRMDTTTDQDALDALLATGDVLMLQSPLGGGGPDYITITSYQQERVIDRTPAFPSFDTIEWVQVDTAQGVVHLFPDDGLFPG